MAEALLDEFEALLDEFEAAVAGAAASANTQTALIDELPRDVARRFQNHPGFFGEPWCARTELCARLRAGLGSITELADALQRSLKPGGRKGDALAVPERAAARLRRVLQAA